LLPVGRPDGKSPHSSSRSAASSFRDRFHTVELLFQVHAKGGQIYVCQEEAGKFAWVLKAPDARPFEKDGKLFVKQVRVPHSAD